MLGNSVEEPSPVKHFTGPFIRYCNVDFSQGLWFGTVLFVDKLEPTLKIFGGPEPREYKALKLDTWNDISFWRFDLTLRMGDAEPIAYEYSINDGHKFKFFVAGIQDRNWRWAFTSCNGFSSNVPEKTREKMGGLPALWNDLLRSHSEKPFMALVGGGDQIYCDPVWNLPLLKEWLRIKGRENRQNAPWNEDLEKQVQDFYISSYINHFSIPGFADASAQIPTINILDDHDFWDGMGSYPEYLQMSHMFQNLKRIAYKYYLLFQHHTKPNMAVKEGYIGCQNGSYSLIRFLGPETALFMIDARGERSVERILSQHTWNMIFEKMSTLPSEVKHLIFVTGVPVVYPRMEAADELLSKMGVMKRSLNKGFNKVAHGFAKGVGAVFGDKAKKGIHTSVENLKMGLGKSGLMSSLLNQFGEPELQDDLVDHWTNKCHEDERLALVERLQKISQDKRIRVTFVAGDVHCGGVGRFFPNDDSHDHRLMYQVISSAIGNIPPPDAVIGALHKNAEVYVLNSQTKEDLLELFSKDVDGKALNNRKLIGRRNWCRFDPCDDGNYMVTLQVEDKDYRNPSHPYSVTVPCLI